MSGRTVTSLAVILTLFSWTRASYVEAVAGAFDGSPARANLQVAMSCGHFNKFLDPATRQWTDDLTSSCLEDKSDILTYCQKKYPGMDVTNIVEMDQAKNISAWCSKANSKNCTTTALVVPIRCLVGTFESDALVVPSRCRFRHLHQEGTCQQPREWKVAAKNSCKKSKFKLASTGMLLPCKGKVDMFQGVEFVCCPRGGRDGSEDTPRPVNRVPPKQSPALPSGTEDEDPYFTEDGSRDETEAYHQAKQRLATRQRERVAELMQQYQEAQKKLDPSDKKYASKKATMTKRYEDSIAAMEIETEQQQDRLHAVHESRIEGRLTTRIDAEEQRYWDSLDREPLQSKKILRAFERYLKSVQKKRKHLISFYKHLRRVDPDKAAQKTDDILELLQASTERVDENVERLQKLPDIYAEIKASVADLKVTYSDTVDDVRFLSGVQDEAAEITEGDVEEEAGGDIDVVSPEANVEPPTAPLPTARKATEAARKTAVKPTIQEQAEQVEVGTEYEDTEYPTEFRTPLNALEAETVVAPDIPVVAVKPIESYTADERDDVIPKKSVEQMVVAKKAPPQDSHSKKELHVKSNAKAYSSMDKTVSKKALTTTPAMAFALACAILGVAMGLVAAVLLVKKKTRRPQVNHNFSDVADPNLTVEQRHIVSMQQNGYENPTYKYFEMQ